ncbi:MAG: ArsA family ATPase, partial [Persicimonas sp.]
LQGRKALVLTIDPARRLANSLGVSSLENTPQRIPLDQFRSLGHSADGELWAMMLDMKKSFDRIVDRYAADEKNRREILENKVYQYFSTSLAGTQEYAASERLLELHSEGDYDLIVLDTPPTTHALDFLEAPSRLAEAVENKALQWLYKPNLLTGKSGLGLFSAGTSYVVKALSKFTGTAFLDELSVFLRHFSTMFEGLGERANKARDLLMSDRCTFVVVTAADPLQIDESVYFFEQLGSQQLAVGGFVVNRVHPDWVPEAELKRPAVALANDLAALDVDEPALDANERRRLAERLRENAAEFHTLAAKDAASLRRLAEVVPEAIAMVRVPFFAQDVHSLEGLERVRQSMFGAE